MKINHAFCLAGALFAFASPLSARQELTEPAAPTWESFKEALGGGHLWLKFRYRFENVDQDGISRDARASTLRTVFGYETGRFHGFAGLIEFEDVSVIGNDLYNSTTNGVTDRPLVVDPDSTEVNQVYLSYAADMWGGRLGRQRIVLDNARFIGNVGWRQNEQTFDAASLTADLEGVGLFYSYVSQANRIVGDDNPAGDAVMDSHLLHASHDFEEVGTLSVYDYLLDYDGSDMLSTNTLGARFAGQPQVAGTSLIANAEYAHQTDAGDNPNDVDADYMLLELGADIEQVRFKVGYEVLEGSGDPGDKLQTPLATLHAFNGWADKFLATPDTGLEDLYLAVIYKWGKAKLTAVYHDFQSDSDSLDYGSEIDVSIGYPLNDEMVVGLKYANYMSDDLFTDTEKIALWLSWDALMQSFAD